jgi:hypothetical protein
MSDKEMLCLQCQYKGKPKQFTPGHFALELLLWFAFAVPGLFYTVWRKAASFKGCPVCESKQIVPLDSPVARKILAA